MDGIDRLPYFASLARLNVDFLKGRSAATLLQVGRRRIMPGLLICDLFDHARWDGDSDMCA